METMNIAVILSHFDKSGVTYNTFDLCEGLSQIGQNVTLVISKPRSKEEEERVSHLQKHGVKFIFFNPLYGSFKNKIRGFLKILKVVLSKKFDVIHFESIYLTFIPWLVGRKAVLTYHSYGLRKKFESKNVTRLIAISKEIKDDAMERHGYSDDQIDIVHHGVSRKFSEPKSQEQIEEIKRRLDIPTDKIIISIVGSIQPRKGHHFLLEAINKFPDSLKEQIHIVFCGNPLPDPDNYDWINEQISKNGLKDKVTLISHCDTTDIYPIIDIFCLPSVWEGFPLVTLEAMMAGCAVLRSNVQGASEQIIEGVTGWTFQSENPLALSEKLFYLVENPEERIKLGKNAKKYALEHFTVTEMAKNTLKVYEKVISKK